MKRARFLVIALVVLAGLPLGAAFAQYPPPEGTCTVAGPASLTLGGSGDYTVTVLDKNGKALPGTTITAAVVPANAGTVTPASAVSDANGKASFKVTINASGSAVVSVSIKCGSLSASAVVSPNVPLPKPPDTGSGAGLDNGGDSFPFLWVFGGIALLGVAGVGYAVARRS